MLRAGVDHIPHEWVSTLPVRTRVGIRDWWADRGDRNIDALPERYPIKQSSERHGGAQEEEMGDPDGKYRTQWQRLKHCHNLLEGNRAMHAYYQQPPLRHEGV